MAHQDPATPTNGGETPLLRCVAWFREQQRGLYAFARLQAGAELEAEDLLSEALKRVAGAVSRGLIPPRPEDLTPYAFRAIRNTAIDTKRHRLVRRRTEGHYAGTQALATDFVNSAAAHEAQADRNRAMQLLRRLPPQQAEVVLLRIWQQLTFVQIGSVLGIPPTTAQSRYTAAITQLQSLYHTDHD